MRLAIALVALSIFSIPNNSIAQRKIKDNKIVKLSASINHLPANENYSFPFTLEYPERGRMPGYTTPNFENLRGGRKVKIIRDVKTEITIPNRRIGFGISYQVIKNFTSYKVGSLSR